MEKKERSFKVLKKDAKEALVNVKADISELEELKKKNGG
jgi:hypothetical protein